MKEPMLPPLNALRVFESVARYGSMNKAAQHLNVTSSSITQHIQKLEQYMGVLLFDRTPNSIKLTEAGLNYFKKVRPAFDIISEATSDAHAEKFLSPLNISCVPSLANKGFARMIESFQHHNPEVRLVVDFSPKPTRFDQDNVDLAIRYGSGNYEDADSELLFVDRIAPICNPTIARKIKKPEDIFSAKRIYFDVVHNRTATLWSHWAEKFLDPQLVKAVDVPNGPSYNSAEFVRQLLKVSDHIALLDYTVVKEDIIQGSLVCPLESWVQAPFAYYILTSRRRSPSPSSKKFRSWLKKHVRELSLS